MLRVGEERFEVDVEETGLYGWLDPYGQGRKPGLTWDLFVRTRSREVKVRDLFHCEMELDSPVDVVCPSFDFSEMEIKIAHWMEIEGHTTEACSEFSFYVLDQLGHLTMEICKLSMMNRLGTIFTVEFAGYGGGEDGLEIHFYGIVEVPFRGIGMYFLPSEKSPLEAGRHLMKEHLPGFACGQYELGPFPPSAPPEWAPQRLVFLPNPEHP